MKLDVGEKGMAATITRDKRSMARNIAFISPAAADKIYMSAAARRPTRAASPERWLLHSDSGDSFWLLIMPCQDMPLIRNERNRDFLYASRLIILMYLAYHLINILAAHIFIATAAWANSGSNKFRLNSDRHLSMPALMRPEQII